MGSPAAYRWGIIFFSIRFRELRVSVSEMHSQNFIFGSGFCITRTNIRGIDKTPQNHASDISTLCKNLPKMLIFYFGSIN